MLPTVLLAPAVASDLVVVGMVVVPNVFTSGLIHSLALFAAPVVYDPTIKYVVPTLRPLAQVWSPVFEFDQIASVEVGVRSVEIAKSKAVAVAPACCRAYTRPMPTVGLFADEPVVLFSAAKKPPVPVLEPVVSVTSSKNE